MSGPFSLVSGGEKRDILDIFDGYFLWAGESKWEKVEVHFMGGRGSGKRDLFWVSGSG